MTAEEGEKNFPCDEEPFPDDENKTEGCVRCRFGWRVHSLRCYGLRCWSLVDYMFMPPSTWIT